MAKNKTEKTNVESKEEKEKVVCKECGKKYLASLSECPYCEQKKASKKKEEEIDEDDEENDVEDYDDEEIVTKKELNMNVDRDGNIYETVVTNPSKEFKDIKVLLYVTIVICVITLLVSFITLSNVSGSSTSSSSSSDTTDSDDDTDTSTVDYDVSMFTEITSSEFIDLFDLDDDTIYFVYTGRSDCSYCQSFLPYLQDSVEEYDYTLYYLDINGVTSDEATEIEELDETLEADFTYTPMVFAIKNGEVIDVNEGYTEYDTYTSFLEDNGVSTK